MRNMATKRPTQPTRKTPPRQRPGPEKGHGGRPIKGSGVAAHVMSVRLSDEDWNLLTELLSDQEAKVAALGVTSYSAADMLRLLVREEHTRRGLGAKGSP